MHAGAMLLHDADAMILMPWCYMLHAWMDWIHNIMDEIDAHSSLFGFIGHKGGTSQTRGWQSPYPDVAQQAGQQEGVVTRMNL